MVAGALAVWNFSAGAPPADNTVVFILVVLALALELLAVALPEMGFFGAGAAPLLALALYPGGTRVLAVAVPIVYLLRAALRDELEAVDRALVASVDAVAVLGAGTAISAVLQLGDRERMLLPAALIGAGLWLGLQRLAARALSPKSWSPRSDSTGGPSCDGSSGTVWGSP